MRFEWDAAKVEGNALKHGVNFDEASTVFADELSVTGRDLDHSIGEARFVTFGISSTGRVLAVRTPIAAAWCESSAPGPHLVRRNESMKKVDPQSGEMRAEYRREDLGPLVRGKYAKRYAKATNIVVIDPSLTSVPERRVRQSSTARLASARHFGYSHSTTHQASASQASLRLTWR